MTISNCGTFDYVATVPDNPAEFSAPWPVTLPQSSKRTEALVGLSPTMQITDAGITPDTPAPRYSRIVRPKVLRSQITLAAAKRKGSMARAAYFHVDKGLTSALRPRDVLYMTRTDCGGLALSVTRGDRLVVGVGAVTALSLGSNVKARVPSELVAMAEAVFKRHDPDVRTHLVKMPPG